MYNGDVGGVSGGNNIQWNRKLAEELDAADGKKDGKISANIWNGFINKTGSSGNHIKNFINIDNAAKSFNYYEKTKDSGNVDWNNWSEMLSDYKQDLGLEVTPKDEPVEDPKVEPKDKPVTEPKVEPKTEPKADGVTAEEIKEAMKDSFLANIKTPQDIKNLDTSKFTLVADCGPNEARMINPETGESLTIKEEGYGTNGTITYSNGTVTHTINYSTIEGGKVQSGEITVKQQDGTEKTYKYTYDENGNVVPEKTETPTITPEQREAFKKLDESGVLDEKPHTADALKANGYGVKTSDYMMQDENGLYYMLDMNGGKTYVNEKGESVRISEFEAGIVPGGKVQVTYKSPDGKTENSITYDKNNKPLSGFVTIKDGDNLTTMTYEFDADGNKVLTEPNQPKPPEISEDDKKEFAKNSPISVLQNGADVEKLDLSGYKKELVNYQGTEVYKNEQTGEQIYIERTFGPGGYKTNSITYTKDGITHEIKFNPETGDIESNIVRAAVPEDNIEVPKIDLHNVHHGNDTTPVPDTQVTKYNNKVSHTKDENGNTVIRVDYQNNDPDFFDEEEVRTPDGKLVSYTTETHDANKEVRYFKKRIFDNDGNLVKVIETTYEKGKLKETKELPVENEPSMVGTVHIGTPVDGVHGDPELQKIVEQLGGGVIGRA